MKREDYELVQGRHGLTIQPAGAHRDQCLAERYEWTCASCLHTTVLTGMGGSFDHEIGCEPHDRRDHEMRIVRVHDDGKREDLGMYAQMIDGLEALD